MTAGMNVSARLWRFTVHSDDAVGGALLSGTVYEECIASRFTPERPSRLLRQQGIEVQQTATAVIRAKNGLVILEGDEYEIVGPTYHPEYGNRWVIQGVQTPSLHPSDRRGIFSLSLNRQDRARTAGVQQ